jgi:hypothetical protein
MRDNECPSAGPTGRPGAQSGSDHTDPARQAEVLASLAREARLLEFALEGDGDAARQLAADLESALENAMDAESPAELTESCAVLEGRLREVLASGMRLSAEMTDMAVEGVLGTTRMPVLTAVLSASA